MVVYLCAMVMGLVCCWCCGAGCRWLRKLPVSTHCHVRVSWERLPELGEQGCVARL